MLWTTTSLKLFLWGRVEGTWIRGGGGRLSMVESELNGALALKRTEHWGRVMAPRRRICTCMDISYVEEVLMQPSLQGLKCPAEPMGRLYMFSIPRQ